MTSATAAYISTIESLVTATYCPHCRKRQPMDVPQGTPVSGKCPHCKKVYAIVIG